MTNTRQSGATPPPGGPVPELQLCQLHTGSPWRAFFTSLTLHALPWTILLLHLTAPVQPQPARNPADKAIALFVPKPLPPSPPAVRKSTDLNLSPRILPPPQLEAELPPPARDVRVDMNSIQLSFLEDVTNQLPAVVSAHHGVLALMDKQDPDFARYLIEPPDWTVHETMLDVSRKVRFAMYPAQSWSLLRSVALKNSIALDRYQACALFEPPYQRCLQQAIRDSALASSHGEGRVLAARLAFEGSSPCGIHVVEVSFAAQQP